jgi:hypothetical protein
MEYYKFHTRKTPLEFNGKTLDMGEKSHAGWPSDRGARKPNAGEDGGGPKQTAGRRTAASLAMEEGGQAHERRRRATRGWEGFAIFVSPRGGRRGTVEESGVEWEGASLGATAYFRKKWLTFNQLADFLILRNSCHVHSAVIEMQLINY